MAMHRITALLAFAATLAIAPPARGQAMPIGTVTVRAGQDPVYCNTVNNGSKFYSGMLCQTATVSCPNTADIQVTYGWTGPAKPQGTVVLLSGTGGTSPDGDGDDIATYAGPYASTYEVVEFEWASPWQDPSSNGTGGNILAAACRPATFLNYIFNNASLNVAGTMCAQGSSAGSAAVAYSMAWYGQASYLTNVELIAGPVLSEIDQGCIYPNAGTPTLCAAGTTNYCSLNTVSWSDKENYVPGDAAYISTWSGLPGANGTGGICASSTVNSAYDSSWEAMSIVDGTSSGYAPTFSYSTPIHGWACQSYATNSNGTSTCTSPNCPNNSASEGKFFYDAVLSGEGGTVNLSKMELTGTELCPGPEAVTQGTDPDSGGKESTAIMKDMQNKCVAP
jgi:hypothetical protein